MMANEKEEEVDETVVIDRDPTEVPAEDESDHTVVLDRAKRSDAQQADDDDADRTVVLDRGDPESVLKVLPARRTIKPAPVIPGFGGHAVEAVGANVVETYVAREIAPAPLLSPPVLRAGDAQRVAEPTMPSVTRQSRIAGVVTLLVFAGSCVVSAVAIIAIIVWFARGS